MWASTGNQLNHLSSRESSLVVPPAVGTQLHRLKLLHWLRAWLRREADRTELYRLNQRELSDLGINSGDLPAILDGTFRREG